jgi:hypothetical protein
VSARDTLSVRRARIATAIVARHALSWIALACCGVLVLALPLGCKSTTATEAPAVSAADSAAVQATLDKLYAAFCFEARGGADWDAIRDQCVDGAVFVAPIKPKETPRAVGIDQFLRDFHGFVASDAVRNTGLHERILHTQLDLFGTIAHAYVSFEAFVPGIGTIVHRGLDSIQLVKSGSEWRVVSFTTQYGTTFTPVPARFLR